MVDFGYYAAWPDELKELSRRHYRAVCRVRCLDAAIARVDPASFDDIMNQLEAARKMQYQTGADFWRVKWQ